MSDTSKLLRLADILKSILCAIAMLVASLVLLLVLFWQAFYEYSGSNYPMFPAAYLMGIDISHTKWVHRVSLLFCLPLPYLAFRSNKSRQLHYPLLLFFCALVTGFLRDLAILTAVSPLLLAAPLIVVLRLFINARTSNSTENKKRPLFDQSRILSVIATTGGVLGLALTAYSFEFMQRHYDWRDHMDVKLTTGGLTVGSLLSVKNVGLARTNISQIFVIDKNNNRVALLDCHTEPTSTREIPGFMDLYPTDDTDINRQFYSFLVPKECVGLATGEQLDILSVRQKSQATYQAIEEKLRLFLLEGKIGVTYCDVDGGCDEKYFTY